MRATLEKLLKLTIRWRWLMVASLLEEINNILVTNTGADKFGVWFDLIYMSFVSSSSGINLYSKRYK